ncbi:ATP-binding protein [Deferribacterales bacterium RsTz2092]
MIDEIQKVPELITEIKHAVDNDNRPGQYLLTGSANISSLPSVSESLAGRVKNIRLRPLTVGEILKVRPTFLERAFKANFSSQIKGYDKSTIFDLAFRGGFPEAVRLRTPQERKDWHKDYIDTLINRDLQDIANIKRQDALRELINILASWSGKFMEVSKICSFMAITKPTIESYINALEAMYLFEKVSPWTRTDYDRVGRTPKTYMTDTGLMASVLGWNKNDIMLDTDKSETDRAGKLMETFVFQELTAQIGVDNQYNLFQYRDREKREIDFLIEREDKALVGVEVKSSARVSADDFAPQRWFVRNILKNKKPYLGIVLYSGENTFSFGENMLAVPIAALWAE